MAPKERAQPLEDCVNRLFATWMHEWCQDAVAKGSKSHFTLRKAFNSIVAHPTPLRSGRSAEKLHGIGPAIAAKLDRRLKEHIAGGGHFEHAVADDTEKTQEEPPASQPLPVAEKPRKAKRVKEYIPAFRSGPYAVLVALYKALETSREFLTKAEIIQDGQAHCSAVMDEGAFSAVNGALATLGGKGLISKLGVPAKFSLTEEGIELAQKILGSPAGLVTLSQTTEHLQDSQEVRHFSWPAGSYDVVMLIDNREVKSRTERDFFVERLQHEGVVCEVRALELGDVSWIARKRKPHDAAMDGEEVVLDYIVERKRYDDLVHSIIDGRFVDQKFRLRQSGINNVVYVVERFSGGSVASIPPEKIFAAIVQTEAIDNFHVRHTGSMEETVRFLAGLSADVNAAYANRGLSAIAAFTGASKEAFWEQVRQTEEQLGVHVHFACTAFSALASKSANLTAHDIFIMQLMAIRGISADKAALIAEKFPSPMSLYNLYASLTEDKPREGYFKDWSVEGTNRKFGTVLSRRLYESFYTQ